MSSTSPQGPDDSGVQPAPDAQPAADPTPVSSPDSKIWQDEAAETGEEPDRSSGR